MKLLRQCNQLTATDQTFTPTGCGPKVGHLWLMEVVSILSGCSSQRQTDLLSVSSSALLEAMRLGPKCLNMMENEQIQIFQLIQIQ